MNNEKIIETLKQIENYSHRSLNEYLELSKENQLSLLQCVNYKYVKGIKGEKNAAGGAMFESIENGPELTEAGIALLRSC